MCMPVFTGQLKIWTVCGGGGGGRGGELESALYKFSKDCMYEDSLNQPYMGWLWFCNFI